MDSSSIEHALAKLPASYEPLLLTFLTKAQPSANGTVVIGSDSGTDIRVTLSSGEVLSVDANGQLPTRFINSSIGQLGDCVAAYAEYAQRVARADEAEARALVHALRETIRRLDAAAIDSPETWWSLILGQAADGLL